MRIFALFLIWPLLSSTFAASFAQTKLAVRVASVAEIEQAMRLQKALGYDILATANGARFSAVVILHLVNEHSAETPILPIVIPHQSYYDAFMQVTRLSPDKVPEFVRKAHEYGADQYIDARSDKVLGQVLAGPTPKLAINVVTGWPAGNGSAEEYSYNDYGSTPPLRVIHKRITSYRLLDFGDEILFDEITGVYGRATGGALGAMFTVIGDGRAWRSFSATTKDNWQVTRTTAKKWGMTITQTAAVSPAGKGQKGLPDKRDDMVQIENKLKQPFEARYLPIEALGPDQ